MIKKKLISVFMVMIILLSGVHAYAVQESNPDIIITDIEISDYCFDEDSQLRVFVTVKNIGTTAAPPKVLSIWDNADRTGAPLKSKEMDGRVIYGTETFTYQFEKIVPRGSEFTVSAYADINNAVTEDNELNNTYTKTFVSQKDKVDLTVERISISTYDFELDDAVVLYFDVKNKGGADAQNVTAEVKIAEKSYPLYIGDIAHHQEKRCELSYIVETENAINGTIDIKFASTESDINKNIENNSKNFCFNKIKEDKYSFFSAGIGPCGFVPEGVYTSDGRLYIRTDVGGIYKYNTDGWKNITRTLLPDYDTAIQGMAIDESNEGTLYIASGNMISGRVYKEKSEILRSFDDGLTWQATDFPARIGGGSVYSGRNTMMLDPNNSDIMYIATCGDGLWRTKNARAAGVDYEYVPLPDFPGMTEYVDADGDEKDDNDNGENAVYSIEFDRKSKTATGDTSSIYVSTKEYGVYHSADGGNTWNYLEGSPKRVREMKHTDTGVLYAAAGKLTDSENDTNGGLWKYENGTWTRLNVWISSVWSMASVDATSDGKIVVCAVAEYNAPICYSTDGGQTFSRINTNNRTYTHEPAWRNLENDAQFPMPGFCALDKRDSKTVLVGDLGGLSICKNPTAAGGNTVWNGFNKGLEELCVTKLTSTTGEADFLITSMDKGTKHSFNATEYDDTQAYLTNNYNATGIDYQKNNPNYVVTAGSVSWFHEGAGTIGYSTDGGKSFLPFDNLPIKKDGTDTETWGNVAVAAAANENGIPTVLAQAYSNGKIMRTIDNGATWSISDFGSGSPGSMYSFSTKMNICSDSIDKNYFYLYNEKDGDFYVSSDNGATFEKSCHIGKSTEPNGPVLRAFTQKSGYLVLSTGGDGLYISKDSGASFNKVPDVEYASFIGTGYGYDYDSIIINGAYKGKKGVFISYDLGKSFHSVVSDDYAFGMDIRSIDGDKKRTGVVYIGTHGHGVLVGTPKGVETLTDTAILSEDSQARICFNYRIGENENAPEVFLNGSLVSCDIICDGSWHNYTKEIDIEKGTNILSVSCNNQKDDSWYIGDVRLESEASASLKEINITNPNEQGTYPVKVTYAGSSDKIIIQRFSESYKMKFKTCTKDGEQVVYLELKSGENKFLVSKTVANLEIISQEITYLANNIATGTYNAGNDIGYLQPSQVPVLTFTNSDGSTFESTRYVTLSMDVPQDGTYKITSVMYGRYEHRGYFANSDKQIISEMKKSYSGSSFKESIGPTVEAVDLKKGINTLYFGVVSSNSFSSGANAGIYSITLTKQISETVFTGWNTADFENGNIGVEVYIPEKQNARVILAAYNEANELVNVGIKDTDAGDSGKYVNVQISAKNNPESFKSFVWDYDMNPILDVFEFSKN